MEASSKSATHDVVNPDAGNPELANLTSDVANAGNPQVSTLALLSFCFCFCFFLVVFFFLIL